MKTLINLIFILLSCMIYSQKAIDTIVIPKEAEEIAIKYVQKNKTVDSLKELKSQEIDKQIKIIALIKKKLEERINEKKIKHLDKKVIITIFDTIQAIKPSSEAEYWEVIPRKWTGRLFHKEDFRIRKYKYVNHEKIYLD